MGTTPDVVTPDSRAAREFRISTRGVNYMANVPDSTNQLAELAKRATSHPDPSVRALAVETIVSSHAALATKLAEAQGLLTQADDHLTECIGERESLRLGWKTENERGNDLRSQLAAERDDIARSMVVLDHALEGTTKALSERDEATAALSHVERDLARERDDHDTTRHNLTSALAAQGAGLDEIATERAAWRAEKFATLAKLAQVRASLAETMDELRDERAARLAESGVLAAADAWYESLGCPTPESTHNFRHLCGPIETIAILKAVYERRAARPERGPGEA